MTTVTAGASTIHTKSGPERGPDDTGANPRAERPLRPRNGGRWRFRPAYARVFAPTMTALLLAQAAFAAAAGLVPARLRCEYLVNPAGIEETKPRLSWVVEGRERGQRQTAYRLLVASTELGLSRDQGDLWDTGRVSSDQTTGVVYGGTPLRSRDVCFWKVRVWDKDDQPSAWGGPQRWTMGLLEPGDWQAQWISFKDSTALHQDRTTLFLPPVRQYRKEFTVHQEVRRATIYASALGLYELHLNGQRLATGLFTPGWSDYRQRAYYHTHDATGLVRAGSNALGAIVAEGWYSGYVGYGLLVGYGPNKVGRYFYGKTPAVLIQLEIEYTDGSREVVGTDPGWEVTDQGPIREADLIMGESFDARLDRKDWCVPGFTTTGWEKAIRAEDNGSTKAIFSDTAGEREVELGFVKPRRLQAYPGPPIRVTENLPALRLTEPKPGVHIFDFGQNFAGVIELKVKGPTGTRLQLRYGEMLHPDGRLMTENLRRARVTDYYTLRGDPAGEVWTPRFTYHGFQFVEVTGLPEKPALEAMTGLVLHSDTPMASSFECSDEMVNRLFKNITWTQRANFIELPTDCPQRDERLGWMGDAQIYVRAATWNADVAAFFTKWMDDVEEAQRGFGAYPDYAPYPMAHGTPRKSFGTAWMDAGIICPWTIHKVYGDTRIIERHYDSMTRFMEFRDAISPGHLGVSIGNPWGDWLAIGQTTPIELIDAAYYAYSSKLMAEMAEASGHKLDARNYSQRFSDIKAAFNRQYVKPDGTLKVETQTAYVLALFVGLIPDHLIGAAAAHLAGMIETNEGRMATGFLGTRPLLPVLTATGHHDLAARLLQSRKFPSWGYEVVNGATTVWERWNSYTKEKAFGEHNAAMNSFSHYSFGAVCEWMFQSLAGIDTAGSGYQRLLVRPGPPSPGSNPDQPPIDWVKATYDSIHGPIATSWKRAGDRFDLEVTIPPNTSATVFLPAATRDTITESGQRLDAVAGVRFLRMEGDRAVLTVESGQYRFTAALKAPEQSKVPGAIIDHSAARTGQ